MAIAACDRAGRSRQRSSARIRAVVGAAIVCGVVAATLLVHHEIGVRALAPSDQDRSAEWSSAWHQWASAPFTGVGADRALILHAADGSSAHFVHNEYFQVAADTGIVGLGLMAFVALSLAKSLRRVDPLSSCAVAAVVCWAVGGAFDFDWHLPVVGLLGGWCAGLAGKED
jgi:hypothetical protein